MRNAFQYVLIACYSLLLVACAQIVPLTGGPKDTTAPKPISEKINPTNGSTNFQGNTIAIPFDEYIKLDNANEKIILIPPHAKLQTRLEHKTIHISWSEQLNDNTTYTIFLNRAVKDITENNDSLMQFVFSTGNVIDTLKYQLNVVDAITNTPQKNCFVGLYESYADTILPTYFALTDKNGQAHFQFIKKGTYTVRAFDDVNKDLKWQKSEKLAFRQELIQVDSNQNDTLPLRLFDNEKNAALTAIKFTPTGQFDVLANRSLANHTFTVNGKKLTSTDYQLIDANHLRFFVPAQDTSVKSVQLITTGNLVNDTIDYRLIERDRKGKLGIAIPASLIESDTLIVSFTDKVIAVTDSLIQLKNLADSSLMAIQKIKLEQNQLFIIFSKKKIKSVELVLKPAAITVQSAQKNVLTKQIIGIKEEKEFGAIKLNSSYYQQPIVIEVLLNDKLFRTIKLTKGDIRLIDYLEPGDYKFKVILDQNKNGTWDTGNAQELRQPEIIEWYSNPIKVRANWEIDLQLVPNKIHE